LNVGQACLGASGDEGKKIFRSRNRQVTATTESGMVEGDPILGGRGRRRFNVGAGAILRATNVTKKGRERQPIDISDKQT